MKIHGFHASEKDLFSQFLTFTAFPCDLEFKLVQGSQLTLSQQIKHTEHKGSYARNRSVRPRSVVDWV